jgi:hypothetical protein
VRRRAVDPDASHVETIRPFSEASALTPAVSDASREEAVALIRSRVASLMRKRWQ